MTQLVTTCPRCDARKIAFDLLAAFVTHTEYGWQRHYEAFARCSHCHKGTIFLLAQESPQSDEWLEHHALTEYNGEIGDLMQVRGFINIGDIAAAPPPEHLPAPIEKAFREGAKCEAVECFNAAGTMFRLCVDLATREMLPPLDAKDGPDYRTRRDLGRRLSWLFKGGKLSEELHTLAACIKEDGNDGAHAATLSAPDVEDIRDFTVELLTRLYTRPRQLALAEERRTNRRQPPAQKR